MEKVLPLAEFRLKELQRHNKNLDNGLTPEILESSKENILVILEWFAKQERMYPGAPWLFSEGASSLIEDVRNQYNESLLKLAVNAFDVLHVETEKGMNIGSEHKELILFVEGLHGFVDSKAINKQQCLDALNEICYKAKQQHDTYKINVQDYYGNPSYFSVMPQSIFDALEQASLKGEEFALVDKSEFDKMIEDYNIKMNTV